MSMLDALGFPFMRSFSGKSRHDPGNCTADGGKATRIDYLIDNDGPVGPPRPAPDHSRLKARQCWEVTVETRAGGSGLYQGNEKEEKE